MRVLFSSCRPFLTCNYIIRHVAQKINGANWIVGWCTLVTTFFLSDKKEIFQQIKASYMVKKLRNY